MCDAGNVNLRHPLSHTPAQTSADFYSYRPSLGSDLSASALERLLTASRIGLLGLCLLTGKRSSPTALQVSTLSPQREVHQSEEEERLRGHFCLSNTQDVFHSRSQLCRLRMKYGLGQGPSECLVFGYLLRKHPALLAGLRERSFPTLQPP